MKTILAFSMTYTWANDAINPYCKRYKKYIFFPQNGTTDTDYKIRDNMKRNLYLLEDLSEYEFVKKFVEIHGFTLDLTQTQLTDKYPEVMDFLKQVKASLTNEIDLKLYGQMFIDYINSYYIKEFGTQAKKILAYIMEGTSSAIIDNLEYHNDYPFKRIQELRKGYLQYEQQLKESEELAFRS